MANIWEKLNNFVVKEGKHETEETSVTQNSSTKNVGNSEDQIPTSDQVYGNETENKHGRNSSVDQFVIPKRKICESGIIIFCLCLFDGGCGASLNNFIAGVKFCRKGSEHLNTHKK